MPIPPRTKSLLLGIATAVGAVVATLGTLYGVTGVWPPLAVIESGSMQHSEETSFVGVVDTGDIVLIQAPSSPTDIVTYVEGRSQGYLTYGDYGDVVLFQRPIDGLRIIHRPVLRLVWNDSSGGFDVPSLLDLERGVEWDSDQSAPFALESGDSVLLHNVSYRAATIEFQMSLFIGDFIAPRCTPQNPCFITMGDYNVTNYDRDLVRYSWVIGRARGELPWMGILNLLLAGKYEWGDPGVPANSSTSFLTVLLVVVGAPVGWRIYHLIRSRRRRPAPGPDEGGLAPVLSVLEERWRSRSPGESEEKESEPGEVTPHDDSDVKMPP